VLYSQCHDLTFHELSEKDGLSQSDRYHFTTDSKGYVWIGSDNGLLRFDGKNIIKFKNSPSDSTSLIENKITSKSYEDDKNNLWFTSFGALNYYDRNSNTFESFTIGQNIKNYHLFHTFEKTLFIRIGLGENGYMYSFDTDQKQFTKSIPLKGNKCIPITNEQGELRDILSIAVPNQTGFNYIENNKDPIHVEFRENTEGLKLVFLPISKAGYVDKNGIAWIGLYNGIGKYSLGDSTGLVYSERETSIISDISWVQDIIEFDQDHLLIGADNGLFLFNKALGKFVHQFKTSQVDNNPLTISGANSLNLDHLDNLWISGYGQKVAFANMNKNRFPKLEVTAGISFVNIQEDQNGDIWCSSLDSGTYVFSPQKKLLFHTKKLRNSNHSKGFNPLPSINFFLQDQSDGWWGNIGNYFFLWENEKGEFKIDFSYFLGVARTEYDRINYCYRLSNGKNIIARGKTIYELKLNEEKVDTLPWFSLEAFDLDIIRFIFQDQTGNIYINDDYGKLLICRINNNYLTVIDKKLDFGILNAFQEDEKRNKIWVTGTNGLGYFDADNLEYKSIKITDLDVVFHDIILDDSNKLWLPSNNGLFRYIPETDEVYNFNTSDGLYSSVFAMNANIKPSKSGDIWLAGKNGINVFDPDQIELLKNRPKVQLTNILVNDEDYTPRQNISEITSLDFPYTQNTLSFEFTALDYADPTRNEFVHQMVGLDESPVSNSNRGFTRYGNIPHGNYVFKLWATNSDLVLNEAPLELAISISPPFYQTWWFYLICLVAFASIIYGVFQYRIAQILKVERLRTRIASDLHDDVGGILSGLAMQTELLELTAEEEDKSKLRQIAEMSRSAMSGMRDTVWAIDSRKDKFEDLLDRIREHAEEVLIPKDIMYDIEIHQIPIDTIISPLIRQNLYLIFKEAITNTAKHSNGNLVQVDLTMRKTHFEMRIHDNGVVDSKSYKTTGLGISNIKMRTKNLGGELSIDTVAGYEITLKIPAF